MTPAIEHPPLGHNRRSSPPVALRHSPRPTLTSVLDEVARSVPDCLAAGFVDLKTGALMGVSCGANVREEVASELFEQEPIAALESLFKKPGDLEAGNGFFQEVLVLAGDLIRVYQRCHSETDLVLMTVCRGSANMRMVLDRSRQQLPAIDRIARSAKI